jgi:Mce-associated membrane protein
MRSRKQTPPELNGDHIDDSATGRDSAAVDALALADAEAAEAEAVAAAARARAKALRLRSEAEAAKAAKAAETVAPPEPEDETGHEDVAEKEKGREEAADADVDGSEGAVIDASDDAVAVELDDPGTARRGLRIRTLLPSWKAVAASVTVVVIAALLTACGYMYWSHRQVQADQQRRAEFEAAARQGVITLMSLDYTKAKEDVQRIIDNSTGQFKTDFQSTAEDFINVAVESKAITETTVAGTAVESMTDDTATVIVAASSRVTNAAGAKQEPRAWRLSVNLARDGEQMKLAKVEFVP